MKKTLINPITSLLIILTFVLMNSCGSDKEKVEKKVQKLGDTSQNITEIKDLLNEILKDSIMSNKSSFFNIVKNDTTLRNELYTNLYQLEYTIKDNDLKSLSGTLINRFNKFNELDFDPMTPASANQFKMGYQNNILSKLNSVEPNNTISILTSVTHLENLLAINPNAVYLRLKVLQGDNGSLENLPNLNYLKNYNKKLYLLYTLVDANYRSAPNEHYDINASLNALTQIPKTVYDNLIANFDNETSRFSLKAKLKEVKNPNTESIYISIADLKNYIIVCTQKNSNFKLINFVFSQVDESHGDIQNNPKFKTILKGKNNCLTVVAQALDGNRNPIGMVEYDVNTLCPPGNCNQ